MTTGRTGAARRRLAAWIGSWAVVLPFALAIAWLLIGPAASILLDSLRDSDGGATLLNWRDVAASPLTRRAISASLGIAAAVATISTAVGLPVAWCVGRLAVGGRSLAAAALNVAANIPATSLVFGFAASFGGAGMITLWLRALWPAAPAIDLYGPTGLIFILLYLHIPLFVLLILPAMGVVSDELWEAATLCGAGAGLFWRRVGLPILAPFVLAGWVLMFVWAIGQYGVPLALGGTDAAIDLITLRIGDLIQSVGSNNRFGRAACLSLLLILLSVGALAIYRMLLRRALRWVA